MRVVLGHSGGATISGVRKQADQVVTVKPAPDVMLIQVVGNDVALARRADRFTRWAPWR